MRRSGPQAPFRGLVLALLVVVTATGCGLVDQLAPVGGRPTDAPIVPPVPPPPDDAGGPPEPIPGAVWTVDGHPAAIVGARGVAGGRIAYVSSWSDVGVLDDTGDVAAWPTFSARGWVGYGLDAVRGGTLLAAATNAGVETWDVASGLPLGTLGSGWTPMAVRPDGATVALVVPSGVAGDTTSRLALWNPVYGRLEQVLDSVGGVRALAWSPDGARLALAGDDFLVVDMASRDVTWRTALGSGFGASLRWNPHEPIVAHVLGPTVTLFDVDARTRTTRTLAEPVSTAQWADAERLTLVMTSGDVRALSHPSGTTASIGSVPPFTLAFDAIDGTRAVIGTRAGAVGIWDVATGTPERLAAPAPDRGEALAMRPDEQRIVTGGYSGLVRTWRTSDGSMVAERLMGEQRIDDLAWSPDGHTIAIGHSGRIDLVDAVTLAPLASSEGHIYGTLAFGPPGRLLASGGMVLDAATLEPIVTAASFGIAGAWAPDGQRFAVGTLDGDVAIHDASSAALLASLSTGLDFVLRMAWSPDGSSIAAASYSEVTVIDAVSGVRRFALPYFGPLTTLAFTADSARMVTSGWSSGFGDGCLETLATVRVWDATTGTALGTVGGHSTAGGVAITRDGRHLALTNWVGQVAYVAMPACAP